MLFVLFIKNIFIKLHFIRRLEIRTCKRATCDNTDNTTAFTCTDASLIWYNSLVIHSRSGANKMKKTKVEILFEWMDQTTEIIQQQENMPYLDSLAKTLETLFIGYPSEDMDEILRDSLQSELNKVEIETYSTEDLRSSIQLLILKGMQRTTQPQHLMTPEAASLLVSYLAVKFTDKKKTLHVFDPVSGTASLLTTVLSQLAQPTVVYASEVDPTLIQIGLFNANLQKMTIEFFRQDSLRPFLMDPVDLVVADLPVGYYPDDVQAKEFKLRADEGHSYSHHLLIEQSLYYTVDGGYLLLLVPEFLFDSDQSKKLHEFLRENAHIVGLLRLPDSAFTSKKNVKSILVLQKQGEGIEAPSQPLLVDLPSLSNTVAMEDILAQINSWFETYNTQN